MNKYLSILLLGVAATTVLASCDGLNEAPKFDDSMSYVSFEVPTISIKEDKGTIQLPIQMAVLNPKAAAVTYEVVVSEAANAAVQGTDFKLKDASGVYSFDGTSTTGAIEVEIMPHLGEYTGDKEFTIKLVHATDLNIGGDNECVIKITDNDHPLADILGDYTVTGFDQTVGNVSYTMSLIKDPKDITVVWCTGICQMAAGSGGLYNVYGNVSEDHNTITFPAGQDTGVSEGYGNIIFCITEYQGGYHAWDTGEVVFTKNDKGQFVSTTGMGFVDDKYLYKGGFMNGTESDTPSTTIWTKQ